MIVDSSAIVAIAYAEPEHARLLRAMAMAATVSIPAPIWLETSIVVSKRLGPRLSTLRDGMERQFSIVQVPFVREHALTAFEARQKFGCGNPPARLNFANCISYATARIAREPLLFVGDDSTKTDVEAA